MHHQQDNMKYIILAIFMNAMFWGHGHCRVSVTRVVPPLELPDGPHWDEEKGVLFYVDILGQLVNRYDPSSGRFTSIKIEGGTVSIVVPVKNTVDRFVVTRGRDICEITWDGHNSTQPLQPRVIASVEPDKPNNFFDDGKADVIGRLWAGTTSSLPKGVIPVTQQANFYSLNPNSSVPVVQLRNVSLSNGLAWNAENNILYYIDSALRNVVAFDFHLSTATIDNKRTVFDFVTYSLDGYPDGMTIDNYENLWVACYGCGKVLHVNPRTRKLIGSVDMPAKWVTGPAFGGPNLDTLYVTTANYGLDGDVNDTFSGALFKVTGLGVTALAPANKVVRQLGGMQ